MTAETIQNLMTKDRDGLLPCAVCGGNGLVTTWASGVSIECVKCEYLLSTLGKTVAQTIDTWNTRPAHKAITELLGVIETVRYSLKMLLSDIEDYQHINNLGGEDNHAQVIARGVIEVSEPYVKLLESTTPEVK